MTDTSLPQGFEALEHFVPDWVLPDAVARMSKRQNSTIDNIKPFYEAMVPRGAAALDHLRQFPLGQLPEPEERLLKLMLCLAEIAPAMEWYNQPRVIDGFPVERIRYLRQIPDCAAQI